MQTAILTDEQRTLIPLIRQFKKDFYLVGGTAIALQIGHRQSIDFDLFTSKSIRKEWIARKFNENDWPFQLLFANVEGFHVAVNQVKLTFFQFPFSIPAKLRFEEIPMPDLLTLAAMKSYALGRRAKWKDYVDIHFLLRDHFSLETVANRARELFGELFSPKLFRQQLCFFDDIDYSEEVSFLPGFEVEMDEVKQFLTEISTASL